jgi:tripartite-type tricarboxylate transporter receptor subunit TctC
VKFNSVVIFASAVAMVAASFSGSAMAQEWPNKPITLIVPFSAGGGSDPVARLLGEGLSERLGQPVLVEFHAGASATIGTNMVAKAPADGYTLLLAPNTSVVNVKYTIPNLPYDVEDVVPVTQVTGASIMVVANTNFAPNNFTEMVEYAKAHPGEVNLAIQGTGGVSHFAASLIKTRTETDYNFVYYKGAGDMMADMLSGVVDVGFGFPAAFLPGVDSGRLKFIASLSSEPLESLPDVQTTIQQGFPQIQVSSWLMLFGPKGMPQDVMTKISEATNDFLKTDAARTRLLELGYSVTDDSNAEKAAAILAKDRTDFQEVFESGAMDVAE